MKEKDLKFAPAAAHDIDEVVQLYRAAVGTAGCIWDEEYPSQANAREDMEAEGLYVLRRYGKLIGAVSVTPQNELDGLKCFTVREGAREFARITVLAEFRGRGYAKYMLEKITGDALRRGVTAWHILAAVDNQPALSLYRSLGFCFCGECEMYGNRYYIGEKILREVDSCENI